MLVEHQEVEQEPQRGSREAEPKVLTSDVRTILRRVVRPDLDDSGESVVMLAQRANTSARTVYRVLACTTESINLDLADRLVLAADSHLMHTRLLLADGTIRGYLD